MTSPAVVATLNQARAALGAVEDERNRIGRELLELRTGGTVAGVLVFGPLGTLLIEDPFGMQERASAYTELIQKLEDFVGVFGRVEAEAISKDDNAIALRLLQSTQRILGVTVTTTPVADLGASAKKLVDDTIADVKKTSIGLGGVALALGLAYVFLRR